MSNATWHPCLLGLSVCPSGQRAQDCRSKFYHEDWFTSLCGCCRHKLASLQGKAASSLKHERGSSSDFVRGCSCGEVPHNALSQMQSQTEKHPARQASTLNPLHPPLPCVRGARVLAGRGPARSRGCAQRLVQIAAGFRGSALFPNLRFIGSLSTLSGSRRV